MMLNLTSQSLFNFTQIPYMLLSKVEDVGLRECGMAEVKEVHRALSLLHDWGLVFHFGTFRDGEEIVFLDPARLMELMSSVVSWSEEKAKRVPNGILDHSQLEQIWPSMDRSIQRSLLGVLHHFEIAYPLGGSARSLVPAMLSDHVPRQAAIVIERIKAGDGPETKLRVKYKLLFVPTDLIGRLLVRTQDLAIDGGSWKSGSAIKMSDSQGVVRVDKSSVWIETTGVRPAVLFQNVCERVQLLLREYSSLVRMNKERVGCTRCLRKWFSGPEIRAALSKGKDKLECGVCGHMTPIEQLQLGLPPETDFTKFDRKLKSSSGDDEEEDREALLKQFVRLCRSSCSDSESAPVFWVPKDSSGADGSVRIEAMCEAGGHWRSPCVNVIRRPDEVAQYKQYLLRSLRLAEVLNVAMRESERPKIGTLRSAIEALPVEVQRRSPSYQDWYQRRDEHSGELLRLSKVVDGRLIWLCTEHEPRVHARVQLEREPWHIDWETMEGNALEWVENGGDLHSRAILNGKGREFVRKLFGSPRTLQFERAEGVRNPRLQARFDSATRFKERGRVSGGELFNKLYTEDGEKEQVKRRLKGHCTRDTGLVKTSIFYAWHGLNMKAVGSVCELGLQNFRLQDEGYFGTGLLSCYYFPFSMFCLAEIWLRSHSRLVQACM